MAHPFLTGLADGSLPRDAFAFYVAQDAIYLHGYAQALAAVASRAPTPGQTEMFARHDVSIKAVRQEGRGDDAQLVIVTHAAPDAALAACVADLGAMDVVRAVASVMRVEGENDE